MEHMNEDELLSYTLQELSADRMKEVEDHVTDCARCRVRLGFAACATEDIANRRIRLPDRRYARRLWNRILGRHRRVRQAKPGSMQSPSAELLMGPEARIFVGAFGNIDALQESIIDLETPEGIRSGCVGASASWVLEKGNTLVVRVLVNEEQAVNQLTGKAVRAEIRRAADVEVIGPELLVQDDSVESRELVAELRGTIENVKSDEDVRAWGRRLVVDLSQTDGSVSEKLR